MELCVREWFMDNIQRLIRAETRDFNKFTVTSSMVFFAAFAIQMITYAIVNSGFVPDQVWITNMSNDCPDTNFNVAFCRNSVRDIGLIAIGFGGYIGLITQSNCYKGQLGLKKPQENKCHKALARLVIILLCSAPIVIIAALIPFGDDANIFLIMFLKMMVPMFIALFILYGFTDEACLKLGLYDKADITLGEERDQFHVVDCEENPNNVNEVY